MVIGKRALYTVCACVARWSVFRWLQKSRAENVRVLRVIWWWKTSRHFVSRSWIARASSIATKRATWCKSKTTHTPPYGQYLTHASCYWGCKQARSPQINMDLISLLGMIVVTSGKLFVWEDHWNYWKVVFILADFSRSWASNLVCLRIKSQRSRP